MIEPSSSEEDEDEVVDAPPQGPPRGQNQVKVPNGSVKATPANGTTKEGNADLKIEKVTSPTSSQNSEKNLTEAELRVSPTFRIFSKANLRIYGVVTLIPFLYSVDVRASVYFETIFEKKAKNENLLVCKSTT